MESSRPRIDEAIALRELLATRFGSLPVPSPSGVIGPAGADDPVGARRLLALVAGRHWRQLTREEVKASWSAWCYLSPEGYRFYLPALLDAVLDEFEADQRFAGTVAYMLNPSYWRLYFQGSDAPLQQRQSLFTQEQYEAIVAFLGFVACNGAAAARRAEMALRHGWNRYDLPAVLDAVARYQEQTRWSCPPAAPATQGLIAQIASAFSATACPPLHELCASSQGDEPAELAIELSGLAWQQIAPALLDWNYAALSFMTPRGVCHVLPAFMRADAMGLLETDGPVFKLTHGLSRRLQNSIDAATATFAAAHSDPRGVLEGRESVDWSEHAAECFAPLSGRQCGAVVAYLEFARDRAMEWNADSAAEIEEALAGYWRARATS